MLQILFALLSLFALFGCQEQPRSLVVFHTNDIHGHFVSETASWRDDGALVGGIAALETQLGTLRAQYPHSIYLDAGDLMTGNPICKIEHDGVKGAALLEMLHRVGITAQCLGNHEFDLGAGHVRDFITVAPYPLLCANMRDKHGNQPLTLAAHQVSENGVRIGIIGLILNDLKDVVAKANIQEFVVTDAATAAQKHIDELDPVTDLIILLTHMGVEEDSLLATRIHDADVIVGGHSHTRLQKPIRVNHVIIVQAGSYLKNLGVLELAVAGDTVTSYQGRLEELRFDEHAPRTPLAAFTDSLDVAIHARYGQVIGDLEERWTPAYYGGSRVGNWICDRLRERYRADVAFVNGGGIRTTWNPGPITMLDVLELLPFENAVTTFDATGAELLRTAREQAVAQGLEKHGALEMSGMTVSYRQQGADAKLVEARIGAAPIDSAKIYRVVTIDYVAVSQPERYLGFAPRGLETTTSLLSDVITEEIMAAKSPLRADSAQRLFEVQ